MFEMIDDRDHSLSKDVFIDMNIHEKRIVFGYSNPATAIQAEQWAQWYTTSSIHNTESIAMCGQGTKFYNHLFRGRQIFASIENEDTYIKCALSTDKIYDAATKDMSEIAFTEILKRSTEYPSRIDKGEIGEELKNIFDNKNNIYPFNPSTVIISKNITNENVLRKMIDESENVKKEFTNKYYDEIKNGKLTLYVKFPGNVDFCEIAKDCNFDIIGSTTMVREHVIKLYLTMEDIQLENNKIRNGEYIVSVNDVFFQNKKDRNGFIRVPIHLSDNDHKKIIHYFNFYQYNIPEGLTDKEKKMQSSAMVGSSMEEYSGVYLKIGDKFNNSHPIDSSIVKRNLTGSRLYRGILDLMNPQHTKMSLKFDAIKANFSMRQMPELEDIIKNCCIKIYDSFCTFNTTQIHFSKISPIEYCVSKTKTNVKTQKTSMPGHVYLRRMGPSFYKIGYTGTSNRENRIFEIVDYEKVKSDFPQEELYEKGFFYYEFISCQFNAAHSTEQKALEFIMELEDVVMYDCKRGDSVREYFHCREETISKIKQFLIEELMN